MRRALVKITPELIAQQLLLPAYTKINGATWDPVDRTIVLSVEHDDLADVFPREQAPVVTWRSHWHV